MNLNKGFNNTTITLTRAGEILGLSKEDVKALVARGVFTPIMANPGDTRYVLSYEAVMKYANRRRK